MNRLPRALLWGRLFAFGFLAAIVPLGCSRSDNNEARDAKELLSGKSGSELVILQVKGMV